MNEYEAVTLTHIKGSNVDTTGQFAIFECQSREGTPFNFAIPEQELGNLMGLASAAAGQAIKILKRDPGTRQALPTQHWSAGVAPKTGHLVLSFRTPGGLELAFALSRDAAKQLHAGVGEVLRAPVKDN